MIWVLVLLVGSPYSVRGSGEGGEGQEIEGKGAGEDAHQGSPHHHQEVPLPYFI